jgi:hypothetical protein
LFCFDIFCPSNYPNVPVSFSNPSLFVCVWKTHSFCLLSCTLSFPVLFSLVGIHSPKSSFLPQVAVVSGLVPTYTPTEPFVCHYLEHGTEKSGLPCTALSCRF